MTEKNPAEVQEILTKLKNLINDKGDMSMNDLDSLLHALMEDPTKVETAKELHDAIYDLARMGIIKTVPKSIPIGDKGLILSSRISIRSIPSPKRFVRSRTTPAIKAVLPQT